MEAFDLLVCGVWRDSICQWGRGGVMYIESGRILVVGRDGRR